MKFLLLGATGRTGQLFTTQALDEGHEVTALVRRADAQVDPRATLVVGDVTAAASIGNAARGHDAIVSALGVSNARRTPTLISDTMRAIIDSTSISGVDRLVMVSAFGVGDSLAKASFPAATLFRTMLRRTYADKAASEELLRGSSVRWTLEYPGALTNKNHSDYAAVALEDITRLPGIPSTSRANVADFLLRAATEESFVRQVAVVTDAA